MKNYMENNSEVLMTLTADEMIITDGGVEIEFRGVKISFDGSALADGVAGFVDGLFGNPKQQ